nr:hypothetical protein CFP56_33563 [Quercus suber]
MKRVTMSMLSFLCPGGAHRMSCGGACRLPKRPALIVVIPPNFASSRRYLSLSCYATAVSDLDCDAARPPAQPPYGVEVSLAFRGRGVKWIRWSPSADDGFGESQQRRR